MLKKDILNNPLNVRYNIDKIELLNDIMGMEAKAEIIFSKMRSRAVNANYSGVSDNFSELNFLLNQYQNKYSDITQNKNVNVSNL